MSTGSCPYQPWKLPEKLQIVKPMEGSQTLHHWSQLATPNFGGLLEERPGVKIRFVKVLRIIISESSNKCSYVEVEGNWRILD